ncbi:MAG: preprotein translocase subunit YajC, partial [Brachybacterium sp.]|nr:preprotein translocase subunit YajC [Brachybacterium sp.]
MELLFLLLLFSVLMIPMLLMSGRQRRMQREQQARVSEMTVGDEVRTHSGFYGLIVEEFGDIVILETEDGSQTKWARQALAMRVE